MISSMISRPVFFTLIFSIGLIGCKKEFTPGSSKYDRPDWLAGKVYTQVKSQEDLSTFALCIELTGYDSIIDISGSYTVFAPDNEAFISWFQNHPEYSDVEDIPLSVLTELVKYHIVQNPWSKDQLMSLDVFGWIDSTDITNNKPRGYKRETLLRRNNMKFGIEKTGRNKYIIVDTLETNNYRKVISYRKYAPVFFKEYFDIYDLDTDDYAFYFDRPFEGSGDLYYAGAKIIGNEIFAENGFVYKIDRVVEPLKNAYELLCSGNQGNDYTDFLNTINKFPDFTYNEYETFRQPGAEEGHQVDSLFNLTYPNLAFDITNEKTKAPSGSSGLPGNVSIRYHHGLFAPTNQAFDQFVNEYLVGANRWGGIDEAPEHIRRIIVNTHMSMNPVYPTDFERGFYNGENDIVTVDEATIVHKEYGSNSTFIGVNEAIVPRAFKTVTGPVYLQRGYSRVMYAIEESGLLPTLKRRDQDYLFFVESDANLLADSSLLFDLEEREFSLYRILAPGIPPELYPVTIKDLRTLILNHIGKALPTGQARKEFIPNMAGNYIIFNNETGEVSGTAPTNIGYMGEVEMPNYPSQISTGADNGIAYEIENWFSFKSGDIYSLVSTNYQHFHNLLRKAGFDREKLYRYSMISENEFYTIFIPTPEAINAAGADTLTGDALRNFLLLHFIQDEVIFTDGNKPARYYKTLRIDESSTTYNTIYTRVFVNPGYDRIEFHDKNGNNYLTINESDATNVMTSRIINEGYTQPTIVNLVNQAVIHEIDKALVFDEMDVE